MARATADPLMASGGGPADPAMIGRAKRQQGQDLIFKAATSVFAWMVLLILGGILTALLIDAWPTWQRFGLAFIWTNVWNPVTEQFGALSPIYGTLVTSTIAILLGVPISLGIAVFLTELCPPALKRPIGIAVELLAGIPSIIYGIWGLFVFAPIMQHNIQPFLISTLGSIPVLNLLFQGPPFGLGLLTAGFILSVMILPFVTAITRDVFGAVPPLLKESAYGLGATTWEVVAKIVLPYCRIGVIGAVMLGLGRALGETMAVTFVVGNAQRISTSLMAPGTTISASIANQFGEAQNEAHQSALIAIGLLLFALTFVVLSAAKLLLIQLETRAGG